MSNLLLINADGPDRRVALIENGCLAELHVERPVERSIAGNIYKGRVLRVLPGMQAAFVDIGLHKAAFLYAADVLDPSAQKHPLDDAEDGDDQEELPRTIAPINALVREGQEILVQVAKEPIGTKGARITSYISLPGRYWVLMPTVDHIGVSRRITSEEERARLRELVEGLNAPAGIILRTLAEGQSEETLRGDFDFLLKLWHDIDKRSQTTSAPALLYRDLDLVLRSLRDLFSNQIERLIVDDIEEYKRVTDFVAAFMPQSLDRVELYQGEEPLFDAFGVEIEVDRALARKVWLRSGGYLVIDQGEALTAVDVNTGRYVGRHNLEDTITKINLEAVKEAVTQLRLRNIGGLIVIDFIDMERESNRQKVWRALQEALASDRAKSNALEISRLGLVEMTRKRVRQSLGQQLTAACPYCEGRGVIKTALTVCYEVLRELRRQSPSLPGPVLEVGVHPEVADLLADAENEHLAIVERRFGKTVVVTAESNFHLEQFEIHVKLTNP